MKLFDRRLQLSVILDGESYDMTNHHIDFNVSLNDSPDPNTARITVYGLSSFNRQLFSEYHQRVELQAGYGEEMGVIFRGYTLNVLHQRQKTTWETVIYASDGDKELALTHFSKTYKKGTKYSVIIDEIAKSFGLPVQIDELDFDYGIPFAQTFHGTSKNALSRVCDNVGFKWSIQHGVVQVLDRASAINVSPTAITLSADTGMVGSPILNDRTEPIKKGLEPGNAKDLERYVVGITVKALLIPDLKPGRLIKVDATQALNQTSDLDKKKSKKFDYNRVYVVKTANFVGNNFGGDYYVEVSADLYDEIRKVEKK